MPSGCCVTWCWGEPCPLGGDSPADLLVRLADITARLIPLERRAHGLDRAHTEWARVTGPQSGQNLDPALTE